MDILTHILGVRNLWRTMHITQRKGLAIEVTVLMQAQLLQLWAGSFTSPPWFPPWKQTVSLASLEVLRIMCYHMITSTQSLAIYKMLSRVLL